MWVFSLFSGLGQRVPMVCVVVEGGPAVLSTVLEYVSRSPPVPVIVFEGTGCAADLLSLIHKQTAADRWGSENTAHAISTIRQINLAMWIGML